MIRLQPGSTRTVSLFPDTTLVRSQATAGAALGLWVLISLLMTASAVALAGLPLATLAFLGFLGTTVTAMLAIVSGPLLARSEEHTSELQSIMRNSYAVFCLKKKKYEDPTHNTHKHMTI